MTNTDVLDIICPNNCWGNGNCSDGKFVEKYLYTYCGKNKQ